MAMLVLRARSAGCALAVSAFGASSLAACSGTDSTPSSAGTPDGAPSGEAGLGATLSCGEVCPRVVAAQCSQGPKTEADCESGCRSIRAGKCAGRYDALVTCGGATPTYTCSTSGAVTVAGCESEDAALATCLAGP